MRRRPGGGGACPVAQLAQHEGLITAVDLRCLGSRLLKAGFAQRGREALRLAAGGPGGFAERGAKGGRVVRFFGGERARRERRTFMFLFSPRYCAKLGSALKKTASITSIVLMEVFVFVLLRNPASRNRRRTRGSARNARRPPRALMLGDLFDSGLD